VAVGNKVERIYPTKLPIPAEHELCCANVVGYCWG